MGRHRAPSSTRRTVTKLGLGGAALGLSLAATASTAWASTPTGPDAELAHAGVAPSHGAVSERPGHVLPDRSTDRAATSGHSHRGSSAARHATAHHASTPHHATTQHHATTPHHASTPHHSTEHHGARSDSDKRSTDHKGSVSHSDDRDGGRHHHGHHHHRHHHGHSGLL